MTQLKNYDVCFINGGDIYLVKLWEKEKRRKRVIEVSKYSIWKLRNYYDCTIIAVDVNFPTYGKPIEKKISLKISKS